ncbi:MAG: hypothetical protein PHF60_05005 [Candidatus ainarchaeum sp.]|nr:hypothetical protein [Candidatus ainarchaeum sp.]
MKTIAALVIILLLFAGCVSQPQLKFSTAPCDQNIDPYSKPAAGMLDQRWEDGTFVAEAFVKTYCGGADITGSYMLQGNDLVLKYRITTGEAVTSCLCAHKLVYEFTDLQRNDYNVTLVPEG